MDDLISRLDHCGDFNHKPDICRYGKAEFPARVLPREMQMAEFLFWYYRGGSCSLKIQFIIKLEEMRYMLVGIWHGFRLNILIYKTIM